MDECVTARVPCKYVEITQIVPGHYRTNNLSGFHNLRLHWAQLKCFLFFQVFIAVYKRNCERFMLGNFRAHEQFTSNNLRIPNEWQAGNEQKHFESTRKTVSSATQTQIPARYSPGTIFATTHSSMVFYTGARPFLFSVPGKWEW